MAISKKKSTAKKSSRKKPGTQGGGKFFRIELRPNSEFKTYRTQDVGDKGHLERIAGKRESGDWETSTWLVSKEDAHVVGKRLVMDSEDAKGLLKQIKGPITHIKGDVFKADTKKIIKEKKKNIKK
jgi:hypothetical protein